MYGFVIAHLVLAIIRLCIFLFLIILSSGAAHTLKVNHQARRRRRYAKKQQRKEKRNSQECTGREYVSSAY